MLEVGNNQWVLRLLLTLLIALLMILLLNLLFLLKLEKQRHQEGRKIDDAKEWRDELNKQFFNDEDNQKILQDIVDDSIGEKDMNKDLIHGALSQVDAVFFTYLSSIWLGSFTRTERTSSLIHYAVNYSPRAKFRFEVLLRS